MILAFGVGEVVARIVDPGTLYHAYLPAVPYIRRTFEGLSLRGCSPTAVFTTNALGLRGPPPPSDDATPRPWRVLVVGGSTTLCTYLDDARTWPALLQQRLERDGIPAWVGNAGFDGHSTRGHLLVMEHIVPSVRPDAVVLLVGVNDLALSLSAELAGRGNGFDDYRIVLGPLHRSRLLDLGWRWWQIHVGGVHVERGDAGHANVDPFAAPPVLDLPAPPEDLRGALPTLAEYRANLQKIIDAARGAHIPALFVTQPLLFGPEPRWEQIEAAVPWTSHQRRISAATYWRLLEVFNLELQDVCRTNGVPCLDLAARIPHDPAMFYDLCHFTEAGAAAVASEVHVAVIDSLRPPRR